MILHTAYLFQTEPYCQKIIPIIPEIESGDYKPLYQLALDVAKNNAEVWKILEHIQMGCSFDDFEHDIDDASNLSFWQTVILAQYLTLTYSLDNYWGKFSLMESALLIAGWKPHEVVQLVRGKPMCDLFLPAHQGKWCKVGGGWLGIRDIQHLYEKLLQTRENHPELHLHPDIQNKLMSLYGTQDKVSKLTMTFNIVEKMLVSAIEKGTDLFLIIA